MPEAEAEERAGKSVASQVLHWARCHPGVLLLGSLAAVALLVTKSSEAPSRRPETEADIVEGETPLFI